MRTWLVIFCSGLEAPLDATYVKVEASSSLAAIAHAKRSYAVPHPWTVATARSWPQGCRDLDSAAKKVALLAR